MNPDHFAILELPRCPWVEPSVIRAAYQRLAASLHPDAASGQTAAFTTLNTAYGMVREPASRVRHLLEVEGGGLRVPNGAIPAPLGELFMQIAAVSHQSDVFRAKQRAASSSLQRALLAGEQAGLSGRLETLGQQVEEIHGAALERLRQADELWATNQDQALEALHGLHHELAYLARWRAQLHETQVALASEGTSLPLQTPP